MTRKKRILRALTSALFGSAAVAIMSGAAMAADLGMKDAPVEEMKSDHTITVNGGLTTDYVFRGQSQSDEGPAVFAGADLAYRMFYVGVWASSVDDFASDGDIEIDIYGGIKKSYNGVDLDLGVIYYAYPENSADTALGIDLDYFEIKAAASAKIWRDITVTGTVFYAPDYYGESGETWTVEGKASAALPFWGLTVSGAVGHLMNDDNDSFVAGFGDDNYTYWNIGLAKTFRDKFTIDVRYHDTDVDVDGPGSDLLNDLTDERVVATVTFNY